eukprot:TRINITY_DN1129_c0_g1_i2.p1 TRINITY_DN1129_c0_g1~~TRINITY_DN1129_c0_g1_i2.p1  ORF type:complete len:365 (-),score=79.09 TRINITY_DN1129_c0_g1_i2:175-1209(-)
MNENLTTQIVNFQKEKLKPVVTVVTSLPTNDNVIIFRQFNTNSSAPKPTIARDPNAVECPICCLSFPLSTMSELPCKHSYCSSCLMSTFQSWLDSGNFSMYCPCCRVGLPDEEVKRIAGEEFFKKLRKFRLLQATRHNPNAVFCPRGDCGLPCIKELTADHVKCECGFEFCGECYLPKHEGKDCEEALKDLPKEERKRRETIKRRETLATIGSRFWAFWNTKPCPQCKEPIEKNGGCHHMSCQKCGHPFCWNCGRNYGGPHCTGRRIVVIATMPVTVPIGIALTPVVGLVGLGLVGAEKFATSLGWSGIKDESNNPTPLWQAAFVFGWELGLKHLVEPFLQEGW